MSQEFLFEEPLHMGHLVRRYKRFLADMELDDGQPVTAHCPNSGSMLGMQEPGSRVALRHVPDPKRKLKWTWELVESAGAWVGCNTQRPNHLVRWAIETNQVPSLDGKSGLRTEVRYGANSRIDLLLGDEPNLHYVEVKNTTLALAKGTQLPASRPGTHDASFPDAVTARGAKHMQELQSMVEDGHRATVVFLVNRPDCDRLMVADHIDAAYAQALASAMDAGVQVLPLAMHVSPRGWSVRGELPFVRPV